jgi:hypothetical protein
MIDECRGKSGRKMYSGFRQSYRSGTIMIKSRAATAALLTVSFFLAQDTLALSAEKALGAVHFETSCTPEAQKLFDNAMLYQHSFWYSVSQGLFRDALKADPRCAIADWGIAMSLLWNPHLPPPPKNLAQGSTVLAEAKDIGAGTERERDYIAALTIMYANYDTVDHNTRMQAYAKAMEQLAARYPGDDEAQIYYALALNTSANPADKTYANQLKGAAILEPIAKRQPQHPGVAHYLIHLYDYPPLAAKGLEAARRYAKLAPAASHAQHMPAHIFTRLGYWRESIASNIEAEKAGKAAGEGDDELHAMDYLVYAYLQLGEDAHAKAVLDEMTVVAGASGTFIPSYALAAAPARYAVERSDWNSAANLEVHSNAAPNVQALTYFARALGSARLGHVDAAKSEIARLISLRDQLRAAKDVYWGEQVDIQQQVAAAWVLEAQGQRADALNAMRVAADAEDGTEKHPVTPGVGKPARELYGVMLLQNGRPNDALIAFETTLKTLPNRLGAMEGAAIAAEKSDDVKKAKVYYGQIVAMADHPDKSRTELADARRYIANH